MTNSEGIYFNIYTFVIGSEYNSLSSYTEVMYRQTIYLPIYRFVFVTEYNYLSYYKFLNEIQSIYLKIYTVVIEIQNIYLPTFIFWVKFSLLISLFLILCLIICIFVCLLTQMWWRMNLIICLFYSCDWHSVYLLSIYIDVGDIQFIYKSIYRFVFGSHYIHL